VTRPAPLTLLALVLLAGCGGSSTAPTPTATAAPTAAPAQACTAASLPQSGFTPDPAHSGPLTVGKYSPNGDIQAALVYFHFQDGQRQVYTDLAPEPATPAPGAPAGPATPGHDQLVSCDAIDFPTAEDAQGFLGAFRQVRIDAKQQVVTSAPSVGDKRYAFADSGQDFAGYPIKGANGAEMAATHGSRFYSVSVFGPSPTLQSATTIIQSMLGQPS
jgi:hypothetical protein